MIPLWASHIPFCAHMMSMEALVVVLRWLHIRSNCPFLVVVPKSDFFPFPRMRAYQEKKAHIRRSSRRIKRAFEHL